MCVQAVEPGGPAYEARLRAGDIISHINGTAVQGLLHVQVVSLILSGGSTVRIQATPLSGTTIKVGHRAKPTSSVMGGRVGAGTGRAARTGRRLRPSVSLFRRLSNRKAEQLAAAAAAASAQLGLQAVQSPVSTQTSYIRSVSTGAGSTAPAGAAGGAGLMSSDSDSCSPPASSDSNSPRSRPSSLHGLKN